MVISYPEDIWQDADIFWPEVSVIVTLADITQSFSWMIFDFNFSKKSLARFSLDTLLHSNKTTSSFGKL